MGVRCRSFHHSFSQRICMLSNSAWSGPLFHLHSEAGAAPGPSTNRIEGMTYGDLVPYLEGSVSQAELGLLRIAQLARGDGELSAANVCDAVTRAVDFIDPTSPTRSQHAGVRIQAVLTLEALSSHGGIGNELRERAFSVLAVLPIARPTVRGSVGGLSSELTTGYAEPSQEVRTLCERAAAMYSPHAQPNSGGTLGTESV